MGLGERIEATLRAHGVQPTPQRLEIGRLLLSEPRHMSADQVLAELRAAGSRVSKATVYNTLNLFCRCGIAREVVIDPTRLVYDSTTAPHHHFFNVDTGELTDIEPGELEMSRMPALPPGTKTEDVEIIVRVRNKT